MHYETGIRPGQTQEIKQGEIGGKKPIAEDKMADAKISMAKELLNAVTEPFTKVVCKLHDSRIISVENFKIKKAELMKSHWIDGTSLLITDRKKPTTTGIFEVFANKAGLNAAELKETAH